MRSVKKKKIQSFWNKVPLGNWHQTCRKMQRIQRCAKILGSAQPKVNKNDEIDTGCYCSKPHM